MTRIQQVAENAAVYGIWTGIVLILLTPFVVTPDTIFPFVVGKAVYSRSLIECVFGMWAILALFRPAYRPPRSWLLLLLAVNVGVSVLAACFGVSPQRSFWSTYERMQGVVDLIHWFAFAVVLASVLRTERGWRIVLNLNLGASLIMAVLTICLHHPTGLHFFDSFYNDEGGTGQVGNYLNGRTAATLGNPLYLGFYQLASIIIAAGFLARSFISASLIPPWILEGVGQKRCFPQNKKRDFLMSWIGRGFWAITLVLSFWVLTSTASRGMILSLLVSIASLVAIFLSLGPQRRIRYVIVGLLSFFVCVIALSTFLIFRPTHLLTNDQFEAFKPTTASRETFSNTLLRRLLEPEIKDKSRSDLPLPRLTALKMGLCGFFERPFLGWGPDSFLVIFGRCSSASMKNVDVFDHSHNKLVEEAATKGTFGLASYLALWAYTLLLFPRITNRMDVGNLIFPLSVGAVLVGYFIQSQFVVDNSTASLQYFLFLAFTVHLETPEEKVPTVERRLASFSCNAIRVAVVLGVLTLVCMGFLLNKAIYSAASEIKKAASHLNVPRESMDSIKQAIIRFEALGNTPRSLLFSNWPRFWKEFRTRDTVEAERLLKFINSEAADAITAEPENWMIYNTIAEMYQAMAVYDSKYEDVAKWYFERALKLAPHRIETTRIIYLSERTAEVVPHNRKRLLIAK